MKKPLSSIIRAVIFLAAAVGPAYFGNLKYQAHIGQKAIDSTGLNVLALDEAIALSKNQENQSWPIYLRFGAPHADA